MHIERKIRTALFLKAVNWRHLDGARKRVCDLRKRPTVNGHDEDALDALDDALLSVRARLTGAIERTLRSGLGDRAVDDYLKKVLKDLKLSDLRKLEYSNNVTPLIEAFEHDFSEIDCAKCGNSQDKYCRGQDPYADSRLVRNGGLCFRWFLDIYEYYKEIGVKYCEPVLLKHNLEKALICLTTMHCNEQQPHKFDHESDLNATTTFSTAGIELRSNICLIVSMQMRRLTLAVMPYIILHEILCHAYQKVGLYRSGKLSESRERVANCVFAEGWLAHISFRLMMQQLIPEFDATAPKDIRDIYDIVHDECTNFHSIRRKHNKCFDDGAYYSAFFLIVFFAHSDMFGVKPGPRHETNLAIFNLAFEFAFLINANATNLQMTRFIGLIDGLLPYRHELTKRSYLQAPLAEAAKEFLGQPDIERLLKNLEQITEPPH